MGKSILLVALCLILSVSAFAQKGALSMGVGADAGIPMGNFSSFGIGGTAWAVYGLDPDMSLTFRTGYLSFGGKDITVTNPLLPSQSVTVTAPTFGIIPILAGGRYYFSQENDMKWYGAAELGLYSVSNGGGTNFGFAPSVGGQFKVGDNMNLDVHANFSYAATTGSSTTWIGLGVGLEFPLQ